MQDQPLHKQGSLHKIVGLVPRCIVCFLCRDVGTVGNWKQDLIFSAWVSPGQWVLDFGGQTQSYKDNKFSGFFIFSASSGWCDYPHSGSAGYRARVDASPCLKPQALFGGHRPHSKLVQKEWKPLHQLAGWGTQADSSPPGASTEQQLRRKP